MRKGQQPRISSKKTFLQWMRRVDVERVAAWEIETNLQWMKKGQQPGRSSEKTFLQWMTRVDEEREAAWEIE